MYDRSTLARPDRSTADRFSTPMAASPAAPGRPNVSRKIIVRSPPPWARASASSGATIGSTSAAAGGRAAVVATQKPSGPPSRSRATMPISGAASTSEARSSHHPVPTLWSR